MFDLSLAHISRDEQERDLVADLHDRQVLKPTTAEPVDRDPGPARALTDRLPMDRLATPRRAAGIRAVGRQG